MSKSTLNFLPFSNSEGEAVLKKIVLAAADASNAILTSYHAHDYKIVEKQDLSPVTDADRRAHEIICKHLCEMNDGAVVISEEDTSEHHQSIEGRTPDIFWLVDPLDGTKEFIKRNGEFTVNIALIFQNRPVLSVVCQPTSGIFYSAILGVGARRRVGINGDDSLIKTRTAFTPRCALVSRSHLSSEELAIKKVWPDATFDRIGSSIKFCRIAEGLADIYARRGPTKEWDTAAGDAVLRAAGGLVTDLHGNDLVYGKSQLLNSGFLAAASVDSITPLIGKI